MILLIWWYLVAYNPGSGSIMQTAFEDVSKPGVVLGEYKTLPACDDQLTIYYSRNPYSFARCEGVKARQNYRIGPPPTAIEIQRKK